MSQNAMPRELPGRLRAREHRTIAAMSSKWCGFLSDPAAALAAREGFGASGWLFRRPTRRLRLLPAQRRGRALGRCRFGVVAAVVAVAVAQRLDREPPRVEVRRQQERDQLGPRGLVAEHRTHARGA